MEIFLQADAWLSLIILTFIEIVLGVDNLLFIAIVSGRLPVGQQKYARRVGLILAMGMRLILLAFIFWLAGLTKPLISIGTLDFSIRDLVLLGGGIFLILKALHELWNVRQEEHEQAAVKPRLFLSVIIEIALFDILFSIDSVITAVGVAENYWVMATAIVLTVLVMLFASEPISRFILNNLRIKIFALCILLLVGGQLVIESFSIHVPIGYVFTALGFGLFIEIVNHFLLKQPAK